jgi:GT2 family glycosyltransferase
MKQLMKKPSVSILIVTYRRLDQVRRLIRSLEKQEFKVFSVILVDNARSPELSKHVQRTRTRSRLKIVYVPNDNTGYTGGNVTGISYSKAELILILNPDTWLESDTLQRLYKHFERSPPNVGVLVPKVMISGTDVIDSVGQRKWKENLYVNIGYLEKDQGQYDSPRQVEGFDGAAFMFKRAILERTYLFDPAFFHGQEVVDLAERVRELGYEIWTCPAALVHHTKGGTIEAPQREYLRVLLVRNALIHTMRNKGLTSLLRTTIFGFLRMNVYWALKEKKYGVAIITLKGIFRFFVDSGRCRVSHSALQKQGKSAFTRTVLPS